MPRYSPTVRSYGVAVSYKRGNPVLQSVDWGPPPRQRKCLHFTCTDIPQAASSLQGYYAPLGPYRATSLIKKTPTPRGPP